MKKLCVFLLIFAAGSLYASPGYFGGLGLEVNGNTRKGAAMGGVLTFGVDINDMFAAGAKFTVSSNFGALLNMEPTGFFRFYFSRFLPLPLGELFIQAELGASIFIEYKKAYPTFYGDLAVGWRYTVWKGLYLEPVVRGGYPNIWGVSISVGYRFKMASGKNNVENVAMARH